MRTLCWGKLAEDYSFKSPLFLAFTWRLFIQISEAIFPCSGTHMQTDTHAHRHTDKRSVKAEVKKGERRGKKRT